MTNSEYEKLHKQIARNRGRLTISEQRKLRKVYLTAAVDAGTVIQKTITRGLSSLTETRWRSIQMQLSAGAKSIGNAADEAVQNALASGFTRMADIEQEYIITAVKAADASINAVRLSGVYASINVGLIRAVTGKVYKDGYTYSHRVWGTFGPDGAVLGVSGDWMNRIKNIISAGIAQGRDPVKIAKDLQNYVKLGADGMLTAGSWGKLKGGARDYITRLGKSGVDYRALRLVRSEMYSGLQLASVENGEFNPGGTGWYDWILRGGRESWPCECESLASAGPYRANNVPSYPHPNCYCYIVQRLMSRKELIGDLKDYVGGVNSAGSQRISSWSERYGLEVA